MTPLIRRYWHLKKAADRPGWAQRARVSPCSRFNATTQKVEHTVFAPQSLRTGEIIKSGLEAIDKSIFCH